MLVAATVFLFIISVCGVVYVKYTTVLDSFVKPGFYRHPWLHMGFAGLRIIVLCVSLLGLWWSYGWWMAGGAAVTYFVLSTISLRVFFERQVRTWSSVFEEAARREQGIGPNASLSESQIHEIRALAIRQVTDAMNGNDSFGSPVNL
jgi:hypothetical protein